MIDPQLEAEVQRQKTLLLRGAVDVLSEGALEAKLRRSLASGKPLRVKLGVDPTSSSLHLGFTVVLNKLRMFQDLGHQAVLIVGEATAMVGDPTGRNKARPRLSREEVQSNAQTYLDQVGLVLDRDRLEVRSNAEWLFALGFSGMVQLAGRTTLARMLERDDFSERYRAGTPIYLHEMIYPLLQGYDSIQVRADVELGGTDQLFNLLVGRQLQEQDGQEPQVCITTPLLVGLDGQQKMSKSLGNSIGITESPWDIFLKIMRIDDARIREYFVLTTRMSMEEIERVASTHANPRDQKEALGRELVRMYHGEAEAAAAAEQFRAVVSERAVPTDLPSVAVSGGEQDIAELLVAVFGLPSKSEARRLVKQGAVSLAEVRISDPFAKVAVRDGDILRAGRRHLARLSTSS